MNQTPLSQTGCDSAACIGHPTNQDSLESRYQRAIELLRFAREDMAKLKQEIVVLRAQVYVVNVMAQTAKVSPDLDLDVLCGNYTRERIDGLLFFEDEKERSAQINRSVQLRVDALERERLFNEAEAAKKTAADVPASDPVPEAVKSAASRPARKRAPRKR